MGVSDFCTAHLEPMESIFHAVDKGLKLIFANTNPFFSTITLELLESFNLNLIKFKIRYPFCCEDLKINSSISTPIHHIAQYTTCPALCKNMLQLIQQISSFSIYSIALDDILR